MKNLIIVAIFVLFALSAAAGGLSYLEKSELREAGLSFREINEIDRTSEYRYEGSSGTRYKYNLSDPVDKREYNVDIDAQINDRIHMPTKPGVKMDRLLRQYGGGVEK